MDVALAWWPPSPEPGGRSQAIRGNAVGFLEAGHDVDLYWKGELGELRENVDEYDLLVTPFFDERFDDVDVPHILQVGGYDDPEANTDYFRAAFAAADVVTVLDPRLALHFANVADLDLESAYLVPNAPNRRLFNAQPHVREEGLVLVPKVGGPYKRPELLNRIAAESNETSFEAHVAADPPQLQPNVTKLPGVPLSAMPSRYARSSIVCNPSVREGQPNVALESFLSRRPFVATADGIGLLQTIPKADIERLQPGLDVATVLDRVDLHGGDHYLTAAPNHLGAAISELMNDEDRRLDLAEAGREWVTSWEYTWADKANALVELVGGR